MSPEAAARAWADAWERGWRAHDPEPIAALYAEDALVRTHPFRDAAYGPEAVRAYATWAFADEEEVLDVGFGEPLVAGDRAAVEYRAALVSGSRQQTIRGVSLLRFDDDGLVVEHRDYWASADV